VKKSGLKVLFRAIMEGKGTEPWLPQEYFSQKKAILDPTTNKYIVDSWSLNIFYPESKYLIQEFINQSITAGCPALTDWFAFAWNADWETDARLSGDLPWRTRAHRDEVQDVIKSTSQFAVNVAKAAYPIRGAQSGSMWHVQHYRLTWIRPYRYENALYTADCRFDNSTCTQLGPGAGYEEVTCFTSDLMRGYKKTFPCIEYDTHATMGGDNASMVVASKRVLERGINWQLIHWTQDQVKASLPEIQEINAYAKTATILKPALTTYPTFSGSKNEIFLQWRAAGGSITKSVPFKIGTYDYLK
jgi:hypothetical protein